MTTILPTINVSFPRSGHRFLRNICKAYFPKELIFSNKRIEKAISEDNANYIKCHDGILLAGGKGIPIRSDIQYLIQYRHPLESLVSYFEFEVKHVFLTDDHKTWSSFLPSRLAYWKAFALKWCLPNNISSDKNFHFVCYGDLYSNTFETAEKVVQFLTMGRSPIDNEKLEAAVQKNKTNFFRYVEDRKSNMLSINKPRDIRNFKYFDQTFFELEKELKTEFLDPMGIKTILTP